MSKVVTSTITGFTGTLTLKDQIGYPDLIAWQDSNDDAQEFVGGDLPDQPGMVAIKDVYRYRLARLPGLIRFVEGHTLSNVPTPLTVESFPATPLLPAALLFAWLRDEVSQIISGVEYDEKKVGG